MLLQAFKAVLRFYVAMVTHVVGAFAMLLVQSAWPGSVVGLAYATITHIAKVNAVTMQAALHHSGVCMNVMYSRAIGRNVE